MLSCKKMCIVVLAALLMMSVSTLQAKIITVSSLDAQPGDNVSVAVELANPGDTQGTAFSVTFDTTYLTLTDVTSTFFPTFTEQYSGKSAEVPSQVVIDNVIYVRPIVVNHTGYGVMLAAVNLEPSGSGTTLFTLDFELAANIPDGMYPISIGASVISDLAAGYPTSGLAIPLLYPAEKVTKVISGTINVNTAITDTDNDGIDDGWEMSNFGDLKRANATSDYDGDGYTDLQEYLNQLNNILDSNGDIFNPKKENAAYGSGYVPVFSDSNIWTLIIPVLLEMNKTN